VFEFRGAAAQGLLDEVFLRESAKGFRNFFTGETGDGSRLEVWLQAMRRELWVSG
jgi:hypothetical protein